MMITITTSRWPACEFAVRYGVVTEMVCPNITDNSDDEDQQTQIQENALLMVLKQLLQRVESQLYSDSNGVEEDTRFGTVKSKREFNNETNVNYGNLSQV